MNHRTRCNRMRSLIMLWHIALSVASIASLASIAFQNETARAAEPDTPRSENIVTTSSNGKGWVTANESSLEMARQVDAWIQRQRLESQVIAARRVGDSQFIRRAYLDLLGRNPDPAEVVAYVADQDPAKRYRLIEQLVLSQGISARLADVWTELLLPENNDSDPGGLGRDSLRKWLQRRFAENQRYDRIVSDLLIAKGNPTEQPTAFFTALAVKPEKLAEKTSRIFLGVTLDCAQCHDHPFAPWKQTDFWSLAAYFAQVRNNDPGNMTMQNQAGISDTDSGEVTLPETETVVPPKSLVPGIESQIGSGSRRQQLVIWLTSRENKWFARAAVNRFWALLMGRGIVEPIDDVGTKTLSGHQDLMEKLATYFIQERYDVRKLMLAIAFTDTYALDSRVADTSRKIDSDLYAVMLSKPLTSHQLANCLRQAARQPTPAAGTADQWTSLAQQLGKIRGDGVEFTGGVLQSLMTQHGSSMETIWADSQSKLLDALTAPHLNMQQQIRWMFLATVSREPTSDELQKLLQSLPPELTASESPTSRQTPATDAAALLELRKAWQSDLLWALVNSTEFAMTP